MMDSSICASERPHRARCRRAMLTFLTCVTFILAGCPPPIVVPPDQPTGPVVCYPGMGQPVCLPTLATPPAEAFAYPQSSNPVYQTPNLWLDLGLLSPDTLLAPNFTLGELTRAERGQFVSLQPYAIRRLQEVRDQVGALRVTSGYRNPAHNADVGGRPLSRHQYGDGFDLVASNASPGSLKMACDDAGASFSLVYTDGHVHCDWRNGSSRGDIPIDLSTMVASVVREPDGTLRLETKGFDEGTPMISWRALDAKGEEVAAKKPAAPVPVDTDAPEGGPVGDAPSATLKSARDSKRFTPPKDFAMIEISIGGVMKMTRPAEQIEDAPLPEAEEDKPAGDGGAAKPAKTAEKTEEKTGSEKAGDDTPAADTPANSTGDGTTPK